MTTPLRIVFVGFAIARVRESDPADACRPLAKGLVARGHDVLLLEAGAPCRATSPAPARLPYGRVDRYEGVEDLDRRHASSVRAADLVVVSRSAGSAAASWVQATARGTKALYDTDPIGAVALLERGPEGGSSRAIAPGFDLCLSVTGGPALERLRSEAGARLAFPLYASVDPDEHVPSKTRTRWDLGYLGDPGAGPDRGRFLEQLLLAPARRWPAGRFAVAGSVDRDDIAWPENVERLEELARGSHPAFYGAQRFTLHPASAQCVATGHSPSARLFEAAACGTPIISEWWRGLDELFVPNEEILVAGDPAGVLAILRVMGESERRRIAAAARGRVLAEHTGVRRAEQLERYVMEPALAAT